MRETARVFFIDSPAMSQDSDPTIEPVTKTHHDDAEAADPLKLRESRVYTYPEPIQNSCPMLSESIKLHT